MKWILDIDIETEGTVIQRHMRLQIYLTNSDGYKFHQLFYMDYYIDKLINKKVK